MILLTNLWHQIASAGAVRLRSVLVDLGLAVAVGLCLVAATVFGLQALHGVLRAWVGPIAASALLAALMLIVALALALWSSVRRNRHTRAVPSAPAPPASPLPVTDAPETGADLGLSAAFLAGFLLARRLL